MKHQIETSAALQRQTNNTFKRHRAGARLWPVCSKPKSPFFTRCAPGAAQQTTFCDQFLIEDIEYK